MHRQFSEPNKRRRRDTEPHEVRAPSFSLDRESKNLWREFYSHAEAISFVNSFGALDPLNIFCQQNADTGGRKFIVASVKTSFHK
jgi:hypothetical protein